MNVVGDPLPQYAIESMLSAPCICRLVYNQIFLIMWRETRHLLLSVLISSRVLCVVELGGSSIA